MMHIHVIIGQYALRTCCPLLVTERDGDTESGRKLESTNNVILGVRLWPWGDGGERVALQPPGAMGIGFMAGFAGPDFDKGVCSPAFSCSHLSKRWHAHADMHKEEGAEDEGGGETGGRAAASGGAVTRRRRHISHPCFTSTSRKTCFYTCP